MAQTSRTSQLRLLRVGFRAAAITALVVAAGCYYLLVLQPLEGRRHRILVEAEKSQKVIDAAKKARKTHADLRTALTDLNRRGAATKQRIPETAGENEFLHFLSDAAQGTGLEIGDYQPQAVIQKDTHNELRIRMKCEGTFVSLCGLLEKLQGQQRLVAIENLTVSSDLGSDRHAVEMTFVLFFGLNAEISMEQQAKPAAAEARRTNNRRGPHA